MRITLNERFRITFVLFVSISVKYKIALKKENKWWCWVGGGF
jgi:hypothetical protein